MRQTLIFAGVLLFSPSLDALADDAAPCQVHGGFEVIVSEPAESNGTLKTWFAFDNGAQTGDGKLRGRESRISKSYTYSRRQWTLQ